jgi:hypothetical protein
LIWPVDTRLKSRIAAATRLWLTELPLDHHDAGAGGDEEYEQLPESTSGVRESSLTENIPTT